MSKVFPGVYTAQIEGPFVVFAVGFRMNRLLAVRKWLQVARAMNSMIEELKANRELGFLHVEVALAWRGGRMLQYWRSFDHLHAYAHAREAKHLPAWAAFNQSVGNDGTVGIWHETYAVAAGSYECVYVNMPRFGLAVAGEHLAAVGRAQTAKGRMGMAE